MVKLKAIRSKGVKEFFKKLPITLAKKAFLTFLGLFTLSLILGAIIFYQYNILAKKIEPEAPEKPFRFESKTYQSILGIWQEKEQRFKETDSKQYPNLFKTESAQEE